MVMLSRHDIDAALTRLGELAQQQSTRVELLVMGGAAMVLAYDARQSTRDVDVLIRFPREARIVRDLAKQVGQEQDLPEDWLNDGAKGYLVGVSEGPSIVVRQPAVT